MRKYVFAEVPSEIKVPLLVTAVLCLAASPPTAADEGKKLAVGRNDALAAGGELLDGTQVQLTDIGAGVTAGGGPGGGVPVRLP